MKFALKIVSAAAVSATLCFSAGTGWADDHAKRLELATEYANMAANDLDMDALIDQMWKPLVQGFESSGRTISEDQIAKIRKVYQDAFTEPMLELMRGQGPVMADVYTLAEIEALLDFYKTPEGRSVMSKMPKILERQQPQIMELVMGNMGPVMQTIQEVLQ